jgi:hypothetical protein
VNTVIFYLASSPTVLRNCRSFVAAEVAVDRNAKISRESRTCRIMGGKLEELYVARNLRGRRFHAKLLLLLNAPLS